MDCFRRWTLCLVSCLLLTNGALASEVQARSCNSDSAKPAIDLIIAYQTCIDLGHQMDTEFSNKLGAYESRKFKPAVVHFSGIIDQTERPGKAHFNRALAYLVIGKERRAIKDLELANQMLPGYSPAQFYRGVTLHRLRRYQQAIDAFDIALNLSAGGKVLAPIYFEKAQSEIKRKYFTEARESLDNALEADSNYSKAHFARALLYQKNGANQLAIADYSEYITLNPESAEALYNRGMIYQDMRRDHLAIRDFDRAIKLNPKYVKARARKGFTYFWPVFPVLLVLLLG